MTIHEALNLYVSNPGVMSLSSTCSEARILLLFLTVFVLPILLFIASIAIPQGSGREGGEKISYLSEQMISQLKIEEPGDKAKH